MAETVVKFAMNKLCDVVIQKIFSLCGVKNKIEHVKHELNRIQCFLRDADRKSRGDERVKNWVNELRDVSHWIEDTVDLFVLVVGVPKSGMKEKIKRLLNKSQQLVVIRKFGKEIDKILAQINEIAESRVKYGIENLGETSGSGVVMPFKRPILADLDETELVGVQAEKEKIVKQLLDVRLRRSVVSIVGPGGLGKSTVAEKAYSSDEVKNKFDVRIWVSVSQTFTLINLLKKILEEIRGPKKEETERDEEFFMKEVNQYLREKRYLIVMDDVWSENLWPQIVVALPDVKNGSRVLITSRFSNILKAADPASEPYELRFLNEQESLKLLLETALPNRDGNDHDCPTDLLDIAKQLAHKCDGLPLALVVLGGLLSVKPLTYHAWDKVSKTMVWSVDGKKCIDILATSYDDMPAHLKTCFMYLACFPEDHKIDAEDLIRLWVSEGLVPHMSNRTLEDTADDYLEELAQRSMIQVLERSPCGSIKLCGLHDLMLDIAIQKAKEDKLLTVCSNGDGECSCGGARRVTRHHSGCEAMKYASSNLRSFLCFVDDENLPNLSRHRLLKVLRFVDTKISPTGFSIELPELTGSTQLRYLRLDGVIWLGVYNLKNLICSLKFLQTLDLRHVIYHGELPDCMWHVKTLRHVLLRSTQLTQLGPPPSADLRNLQTLSGVRVPESWDDTALPNIPNLRTLKIEKTMGISWGVVVAFLHTLKNLVNLSIDGADIPLEVVDMQTFPFYQHLKYLLLRERLPHNDDWQIPQLDDAMFPTHLTDLTLHFRDTRQDLMAMLEKLQGLRNLRLSGNCSNTKMMRCSAGGFPQLQYLSIKLSNGEKWEILIEEGAMPVLKTLYIDGCFLLQVPLGLQHLTTVRELIWHNNDDDSERLEELRNICKDLPSVEIRDWL